MTEQTQPMFASVQDIVNSLNDEIYEATNGVVQDGPFKGMQIYPDSAWPHTNRASELLGFFEQELHPELEREIRRLKAKENPVVVNVGCSDGYYAVGIGRRVPTATVMAFDIDERALYITKKNAELNKVLLVDGSIEEAFEKADLIVMDCEGNEYDYLDPQKHPGLKSATVIVELHPSATRGPLQDILRDRFGQTHSASIVQEGGRDPNRSPMLWKHSSFERWLAVCESRPLLMTWAILRPRPVITKQCGECGLCCKLDRVEAIGKPKGILCKHRGCDGCEIYDDRPETCRNLNCLWLLDDNLPESMRPDKIGAYAYGATENGYMIVAVDPLREDAAPPLIDYITNTLVLHALIEKGASLRFVTASGREMPNAIKMDWMLK